MAFSPSGIAPSILKAKAHMKASLPCRMVQQNAVPPTAMTERISTSMVLGLLLSKGETA